MRALKMTSVQWVDRDIGGVCGLNQSYDRTPRDVIRLRIAEAWGALAKVLFCAALLLISAIVTAPLQVVIASAMQPRIYGDRKWNELFAPCDVLKLPHRHIPRARHSANRAAVGFQFHCVGYCFSQS